MSRRAAEDVANGQSDPKRAKVDPPKPAFDIAAIRAQIAAKKAALEAGAGAAAGASSPAPTPQSSSGPAGPAALPPTTITSSVAERLAAAKARIEKLNARSTNPYLGGNTSTPAPAAPVPNTNTSIALHPLLVAHQETNVKDEKNEKKKERERYKPMAPKFSTVKANAAASPLPTIAPTAPAPSLNPYASTSTTPNPEEGRAPSRKSKKLQFSQPGRYVKQGDVLRNEEKMEALRQRIAEASRKAGLDSEFDTLGRSLKVSKLLNTPWYERVRSQSNNVTRLT